MRSDYEIANLEVKLMNVETGKSIKVHNLVSIRKKMTQDQVQYEVMKMGQLMKEKGIKKDGPMISATFGVEIVDGRQLLDMEFLVPVDKEVDLPEEYTFKKKFHLVNALYTRHEGDLIALESTYQKLQKYMNENTLQPITSAYNMNVNEEQVTKGEQPIIDLYIGVNPSVL